MAVLIKNWCNFPIVRQTSSVLLFFSLVAKEKLDFMWQREIFSATTLCSINIPSVAPSGRSHYAQPWTVFTKESLRRFRFDFQPSYLLYHAAVRREPFLASGEQQMPLISSSDRQLVIIQKLELQCHNTRLQIISPRFHAHFPSSSLFHSPVSPLLFRCSTELEWITCHGNNPPSLLLPISPLFEQKSLLSILSFFPCSRSIHGSFHPFDGLDSCVSVIANLIFPSLKTWSMSPLGNARQTQKRQN